MGKVSVMSVEFGIWLVAAFRVCGVETFDAERLEEAIAFPVVAMWVHCGGLSRGTIY